MTKKNNSNYRLKVTTACQNCQRRKIKCSGEIPCRYCSKVDKKCEPGKPGKKRGPPPGQEVIRSRNRCLESVYCQNADKDPGREELRHLNCGSSPAFPPGARIPLPPRIPPMARPPAFPMPIPPGSRFPVYPPNVPGYHNMGFR